MSVSDNKARTGAALGIVSLAILAWVTWHKHFNLGTGVITDPFHKGEHYAALATLFGETTNFIPITIHGGLDFIPGWLALLFFGHGHYFFPTEFAFSLLNSASALLLFSIVFYLTRDWNKSRYFILPVAAALSPLLVGYREPFLLSALFLYFILHDKPYGSRRLLLEAALGGVLAINLLWSFDRGIAGVLAIGAAGLISAYSRKRHILTIVVFLLLFAGISMASPVFSPGHLFDNVRFLTQTSSQWSYPMQGEVLFNSSLVFLLCLTSLYALVTTLPRPIRLGEVMALHVMLGILIVLFTKIATNRADVNHLVMGLWIPAIAYLAIQNDNPTAVRKQIYFVFNSLLVAVIAYSFFVPHYQKFTQDIKDANAISSRDHWLHKSHASLSDTEMSLPGIRWVVDELRQAQATCIFDLSNHGIINGLSQLPTCSRFSYLVYATPRFETEILTTLQQKNPPVIIYSTEHWSYQIDGNSMKERLPRLDRYIKENYPTEKCNLGYCLRFLPRNSN